MPVDLTAAETFVLTHARLLERRRLEVLLHNEDPGGVLKVLAAYQNADGGFGQALEPDVRAPHSETTATLSALELLATYDALDQPEAERALRWVGSAARADGGLPFLLPASMPYPRAPWMQPTDEGSHLTFGFVALAQVAGCDEPWVAPATDWCWDKLKDPTQVGGYLLKYALTFLDAHPDDPRTAVTMAASRELVGPDGSVPVPGGADGEVLTPLTLSPHRGLPSRELFNERQIEADLDRLAAGQTDDGGWTFDWLEWCPAQGLDWRGVVTVEALSTLREHGRR